MKTRTLNVIALSFCITLVVGIARAAKFESSPAADEVAQRVLEAQKPETVPEINSDEQAMAWMKKTGFKNGWDDDKKWYVAMGTGVFDTENPIYDDGYVIKRNLQTMVATLKAKKLIIEFIRTKMNARDKVFTPGHSLAAVFKERADQLSRKMEAQKKVVAKYLADLDAKEAEHLEGLTLGDRMNAAMDAAITKLDAEYDTGKLEEKKKKKYKLARDRYHEAQKTYDELQTEAAKHTAAVQEEATSEVETVSKQPLFGAVTVAQFESWNEDDEGNGQYRVTLVVLWSKKMEKIVRAMIKGEEMLVKPGSQSIEEWVDSQDWSQATGSRRFRDHNGVVYFVGISAAALGSSASSEKKAKINADKMAQKEAVMSIFADVEATTIAAEKMQTLSGGLDKDMTIAAMDVEETLNAEFENREVSGLEQKHSGKYLHPISQQEIWVSIYAISSRSARAALWAEKEAYLTAMLDEKAQAASAGIKAGLESSRKKAKDDTKVYDEAKAKTEDQMDEKAEKATEPAKSASQAQAGQDETEEECPQGQSCPEKKKPQSGSTEGAGSSDASW